MSEQRPVFNPLSAGAQLALMSVLRDVVGAIAADRGDDWLAERKAGWMKDIERAGIKRSSSEWPPAAATIDFLTASVPQR